MMYLCGVLCGTIVVLTTLMYRDLLQNKHRMVKYLYYGCIQLLDFIFRPYALTNQKSCARLAASTLIILRLVVVKSLFI